MVCPDPECKIFRKPVQLPVPYHFYVRLPNIESLAADLKYNGTSCSGGWNCNSAAKWVHDNCGNYGLYFRLSNEPWHIEPKNVVGGNYGSCTAPC